MLQSASIYICVGVLLLYTEFVSANQVEAGAYAAALIEFVGEDDTIYQELKTRIPHIARYIILPPLIYWDASPLLHELAEFDICFMVSSDMLQDSDPIVYAHIMQLYDQLVASQMPVIILDKSILYAPCFLCNTMAVLCREGVC